jgi:hypothetical protein
MRRRTKKNNKRKTKRIKNRKRKSKKNRRGGDPNSEKIYTNRDDYVNNSRYKPKYINLDEKFGISMSEYYRVRGGNETRDHYRKLMSRFNNGLFNYTKKSSPLLMGALFNASGTAKGLLNVYNNTDKTKNSGQIFRDTLKNSKSSGHVSWVLKNSRDNIRPLSNMNDVQDNYDRLIKTIEGIKIGKFTDRFNSYLKDNSIKYDSDVTPDALANIIQEAEKDAMPDKKTLEEIICSNNQSSFSFNGERDANKNPNFVYSSYINPNIEELLQATNLSELYSKIETMKNEHIERMPFPYQVQLKIPNYDPNTKFVDPLPDYCPPPQQG